MLLPLPSGLATRQHHPLFLFPHPCPPSCPSWTSRVVPQPQVKGHVGLGVHWGWPSRSKARNNKAAAAAGDSLEPDAWMTGFGAGRSQHRGKRAVSSGAGLSKLLARDQEREGERKTKPSSKHTCSHRKGEDADVASCALPWVPQGRGACLGWKIIIAIEGKKRRGGGQGILVSR